MSGKTPDHSKIMQNMEFLTVINFLWKTGKYKWKMDDFFEKPWLFLISLQIFRSRKGPVHSKMSFEWPRLTRFLRFLTILNEPILKKYMCEQNDFLDIERGTWGPSTLKILATEIQWIMKYASLGFSTLNDPKNWKFSKNFFST